MDKSAIVQQEISSSSLTSTESTLLEIWSDVLETDQLTVNDNFFELGGHSFLAIQVMSQMREIYPVEFALHDFLDAPTIVAQARIIDQTLNMEGATVAVAQD